MADPVQGVNRTDAAGAASAAQTGAASAVQTGLSGPLARPDASAGASNDSADVSKTEALLHAFSQADATVPLVDEARVNALREAIASGTLQPDPQVIADKIVQWEGMLAGGKDDA